MKNSAAWLDCIVKFCMSLLRDTICFNSFDFNCYMGAFFSFFCDYFYVFINIVGVEIIQKQLSNMNPSSSLLVVRK